MSYINVGAFTRNGQRVPSKKALKELLKADPSDVLFDPTSLFGDQAVICGDDLSANGAKLTVCGPDPYLRRSWFATVERTEKGINVS
jgi:hypothetical protein